MPQILPASKIVIRDEGTPTIKAIAEALELALLQGAPSEAEVTLNIGGRGSETWSLLVTWTPEIRS